MFLPQNKLLNVLITDNEIIGFCLIGINIIGFGSHQENCFLSFLQDNLLPIPYPMNSENPVSLTSIQRSWKRRVNVNTVYYFGIIICFSTMNFVLKTNVLNNLFDEHPIELKWHHGNGTLFANLRLTSYLLI